MSIEVRDLGALDGPVLLFGGPYSNLQATEALIGEAAARSIPAARAICTGDVVAYCGQPAETLGAIRSWGCPTVAGNCEEQLAAEAGTCGCGFAEGSVCDALSAEWYGFAAGEVGIDDRLWMAALPRRVTFTHQGRRFAAIHGGARDVSRFIWPGDRDAMAEEIAALEAALGPIHGVVAGHSGIPFIERLEDRVWINAGVIGMPAHDGRAETAFAVLDGEPTLHRLAYDAAAAAGAMAGRNTPYAAALTSGWWPSEDVLPDRLRRAARAA